MAELQSCVQVCDCNFTMANTGTDCTPMMEVTKKLYYVPVYNSAGTRNFISLAATLDAAYLTARLNDIDPSKRWYPLPDMKDIHDTRGDAIYETFPDRSEVYIAPGVRQFDGVIVGRDGNTTLLSKIETARCGEMGVFCIDRLGDLIGIISNDGTQMFPIRLDSDSISATYIKKTDTTTQKLMVKFNFHPDESDNCLRMITGAQWGDANLLAARGLLNGFGVISGISQTGLTLKVITEYGTPIDPTTIKGLVTANFVSIITAATSKVRNTTTNADLTVTVTESTVTPGTYTLAWASQTVGNVIRIGIKLDGFDFSAVALLAPVIV